MNAREERLDIALTAYGMAASKSPISNLESCKNHFHFPFSVRNDKLTITYVFLLLSSFRFFVRTFAQIK